MAIDEELLGRELQRQWLDEAPQAVLLLDCQRQVLWMNRRARSMVREEQVLSLRLGVLQAGSAREGAALEAAMRDLACGRDEAGDSRILRWFRPGGPPMLAFVSLVCLEGMASEPGFRLVVCELADAAAIPASRLLMRCFVFSPAEARVAVGLCEGLDAKRLARREGNSVHTIRSQVRGVLEKTRTTRQADLLRLLLSLPVGH